MKLNQIDLKGYGRFSDTPGSFEIMRYRLPAPWDYCYTNGDMLLRIRADGAGYLQAMPPNGVPLLAGPPLLFRENAHVTPNMLTWIIPEKPGRCAAFTNFWLPVMPGVNAAEEPEEYRCLFDPACARYRVVQDGWLVETTAFVPPHGSVMVMTVSVTNRARISRACAVMPVVRPYLASLSQAPWDVACWYQTIAFCRVENHSAFWMQTRDAGGIPARRLHAGILSDFIPDTFEVSCDRFVGNGEWNSPRAVADGRLALAARGAKFKWGDALAGNAAVGQPPLAAMARRVALRPGEKFEFTTVIAKLPDGPDGKLPPPATLAKLSGYLSPREREKVLKQLARNAGELLKRRNLKTPDESLSRYINEFVPLQAYWVSVLDRGWPGGFRGVRDAAQDATSLVGIDPRLARVRLVEIFNHQWSNGLFPRAYYVEGVRMSPIVDSHVDAGVWVWELLNEYVCQTRDFKVLAEKTRWQVRYGHLTILERVIRLFEYYLQKENLGKHGLCKIRGGDWNDSVNRAGLEGKGESVMVSCQLVLALEEAADLLRYLDELHVSRKWTRRAASFAKSAAKMRKNLMRHAFNAEGYLNGVFNDAGRWVFSPKDPDGRRRINGPANSYAIIAGIVQGDERGKVFKALAQLKGPFGWRLFHPPIAGNPPILKLGRIGQGDLAPGLGENGTPYNHGSQGFLGRAAWTAGKGNLLYEVLRYMFPYDQKAHPVDVARTAPYGIVNHWKEAIGLEGVGGDVFLSGSIATSLRNAYEGLAGFRVGLKHVIFDPCIPAKWDGLEYEVDFLGSRLHVTVKNNSHVECGVARLKLDGKEILDRFESSRLGRRVAVIPLNRFRKGKRHKVEVIMG